LKVRFWLGACLASIPVWTASLASAQSSSESSSSDRVCVSQLASEIDAIVARPEYQRARWGILVETRSPPAQQETLYAREAERYFIPASNVKLLTTAAALSELGAAHSFRTSVYQVADQPEVILRLVGRGDPGLTDADLQQLAQQIARRGIRQIDRLIVDDRYFRGEGISPSWAWEDVQAGYGAPATSFMLNQNAIELTLTPQTLGQPLRVTWQDPIEAAHWQVENQSTTVAPPTSEAIQLTRQGQPSILRVQGQLQAGSDATTESIAVPEPTQYFVRHFRQALATVGINLRQIETVNDDHEAIGAETEIAAIASPPLATLLIETNQSSNNLYAEALLRQLGTVVATEETSSLAAGLTVVAESLSALGIDASGYVLADGSGLSRHNLSSPAALVQTLQTMANSPHAELYRESLAIAGISGTLRNRFVDTPVQGNLFGKTGAMSGVAALSGYLEPVDYPPLVFSILVNQFEQPVREVRTAIDEIVLQLAQLNAC
jgi:serine-type D-Ala-D-Ala carboxypeptidase/endopeptidase (penicillin-binding protein 4)